jgi:hypothetical protein
LVATALHLQDAVQVGWRKANLDESGMDRKAKGVNIVNLVYLKRNSPHFSFGYLARNASNRLALSEMWILRKSGRSSRSTA